MVSAQHCLCLPLLFSHHILLCSYAHIEHTQPQSTVPSSHCPRLKIQEFWVIFRFVSSNRFSCSWDLGNKKLSLCPMPSNQQWWNKNKCVTINILHSEVKRMGDIYYSLKSTEQILCVLLMKGNCSWLCPNSLLWKDFCPLVSCLWCHSLNVIPF